jgi:hypothetical protein
LLSSLFVNGTSLEQQKIAAQLFSALHENENISPILLSLRCLNEIIEETNLTTQVKMLATLSSRFHELTQSLPWKQDETAVEVLCFISKVYRKVATKASECKLADEIPANETEILVGSFGPWIEIVIVKLSESFQTSEEIFTNLSLLLEIIKFICIAFESFPYLYEVNEHTTLPAITALCWKYLLCLIEIKHLNAEELKGYETASEDGDRVSIDIFVILIFELLQICLSASGDGYHQDSCSSPLIGSNELINLIRVLMRYIQLSSEQYDQATYRGNEFIAAEEDDTLELSLRHTGKIFLKNLSKSSFKDLMESIFEILETDLNEFNQIFVTSHISFEWILKLEAMIFTLAAIGRPIMKKYFKSIKGEMSVSCSPAPFVKRNQTQRHKKEMEETINENDTVRLSQIIHTLVNNLYQFPSNAQDLSPQEVVSFSSLAIVRGGISKLLTIYSPILVKFISLQPIISISLNLSLLPSMGPNELYPGISEPLSSRLLHCRAYGELLRVASKTFDPMTITQNPSSDEQSLVQVALQSCIELCPLCNDSTIHIPLEIMTNILNIVTQAFEMEFQSTQQPTLTSDAATLLSDDVVIHLVRIGLTVWSVYCYDPFALEMAKDMLSATVHCCSFRPNTLATFLEQFVPPIEHFIGELVGNQSSKMISDLAVKLLAESVSRTSSFSAYGPEASQRLSLPTIQAISRIMHFSTDVDGLVDVGNTLQSLVILLSSKHFTPGFFSQNGGDDLIDDFIQETLLCIRMIFSKSMDYNYSSAIGSLYQLVSHFPSHSGKRSHGHGHERGNGYQEFIQQTVNLIMSLGKTNNHRNILIMGLVHIFNKNPLLIAESLGHIKLINPSASGGTEGGETALQYLLEVWFELHPLLEASYSLSVSTNGLIELIRMYSLQGISSGFLIRVLRLLLETLPSVLRNESQPEEVSVASPLAASSSSSLSFPVLFSLLLLLLLLLLL